MTSLNLVPRAGEMSIMFETSSSGDEARMANIPFGTLAANGGSISMPKSVELTIRGISGIPISDADVVCQAFKDAGGTQVLGSPFTYSESSEISPEPVTIGSIFCSDAEGVQARIRGNGASEASSTTTRTSPSPSAATNRTANDAEPDATRQASALATATRQSPSELATTSISSILASPASAASVAGSTISKSPAQFTGGANGIRTQHVWTISKLVNVSILALCYMGWFMH